MKRTKIVATVGPACASTTILTKMIRAGMNVARLNFSHGTHAGHRALLRAVRAAAKQVGEPVTILADLQGPKIRLGVLPKEGVELKKGGRVALATVVAKDALPVTYAKLHRDLKPGERIFIDDGLVELRVEKIVGRKIYTRIISGGRVSSHKGMNFPDSTLYIEPITAKDREDLAFAARVGVDWIALSFVTRGKDVERVRRALRVVGDSISIPSLMVKIERRQAIENFNELLAAADGIMIARGDLGMEIPAAEVPLHQKKIIESCRLAGKPVVVATQMLDSMIRNPRPTRAEVSDVANAVCDHSDAVMLSGETASGAHPLAAVRIMAQIITKTEASSYDDVVFDKLSGREATISHALKELACGGQLEAVVASLAAGPWVETLLSTRPEVTLFLAVPDARRARQANLRWGVRPFVARPERMLAQLKQRHWLRRGMRLAVIIGGAHGGGFDLIKI